jgi:hypothetical protein
MKTIILTTAAIAALGSFLWKTIEVPHNNDESLLGSYYQFRINELIRVYDEKALSLHASEI